MLPDTPTFFTALAHPLRLRALLLLHAQGELCVCELCHALDVSQPMISRHLAQLRAWGVVSDRRQGLWIHYRLHPDLPDWALNILRETARAKTQDTPFADDQAALTAMPNRPGAPRCA
ncbi:MAG: metalloregulator ArsR/SmtB family transcription factor [Gammaproteobacteria bacterium]|nr:metalloregulator ArsR/SmtB family transcription factor [Gammaproteobacteria bacterium]